MHTDESQFKKFISQYLKRCRPGDWQHAQRVVAWVKKLGRDRPDLPTLVRAAYVHDIGWTDVLRGTLITLEVLKQWEDKANSNTEPMIREAFTLMDFSEQEIQKVIRLVKAADKHEAQGDDEAIIVDADNLSKLDSNHFKEKFKPEAWAETYAWLEKMLPSRITTKEGKAIWPKLLSDLKNKLPL